MTAEYLGAIASIGTLVVIIVTAIAALRQLRTMAHGNHVAALSEAIAQPGGEGYPRGVPRMRIEDRWLAEDRAHERVVE